MKTCSKFTMRHLLRYLGLGTALVILLVIVCAGSFGEFLCRLPMKRICRDMVTAQGHSSKADRMRSTVASTSGGMGI